ncbi:hypothetical protein ACX1DX_13970 [Tessaracoccus sp. Y36]
MPVLHLDDGLRVRGEARWGYTFSQQNQWVFKNIVLFNTNAG